MMHVPHEKPGVEVSGTVSTPVTLNYRLPDRLPYASFGIVQEGRPMYAVHLTGPLARRARTAVAKGDTVTVSAGPLRPRADTDRVVDVDALSLTVNIGH
jgi:hypothetical protein